MPKTIQLDQFRYISNEAWRALIGIEMGLKNHELVPLELALKISRCRRSASGFVRLLREQLISNSLVAYETDPKHSCSGYRLTNLGYDYLALRQLFRSDQLSDLGSMIGAGKESDVYAGLAGASCGISNEESDFHIDRSCFPKQGDPVVVKFHRLGRTSFRKVKEKRDYHEHRNACNWLYLDRLASQREFQMMQALYSRGLSVPVPLAHNRNTVVMSYIDNAAPLYRLLPQILRANDGAIARILYVQAKHILEQIVCLGLVHGDFNEFNLMVSNLPGDRGDDDEEEEEEEEKGGQVAVKPGSPKLVLIDFPQMISRDHELAEQIYQRDAQGMLSFFSRYFDIPESDLPPTSIHDIERTSDLDVVLKAPGYASQIRRRRNQKHLTHDSLLGAVARVRLASTDESLTHTEDSDESDGHGSEQSNDHSSLEDEESESTEDDHQTAESVRPRNPGKSSKSKEAPTGVITQGAIRERHRRERRQKEQAEFQRRIKRRNRAETKKQGRENLKAEVLLFDSYMAQLLDRKKGVFEMRPATSMLWLAGIH